jgi:DNA-directed RNA polymerase specialized sigma24 family protein
MSYREAADVMGVSPQTVANQVSAALSSLREMLAGHLPTEEPLPLPFRSDRRTG